MQEVYSHEFAGWQKVAQKCLGMWRINRDSIDFTWGYFAPHWGFEFVLKRGGYFDNHYSLLLCFIWGVLHVKLPFRTRLSEGCDMPRYGIAIHGGTLWIHTGGKYDESMGQMMGGRQWITWDLPFVTWKFDEHRILTSVGTWYPIKKNESSWELKPQIGHCEVHDYYYTRRNGEIQHVKATCYIEEREWHRKWLPMCKMVRREVDVSLDGEIGEGTGSWKGGTVGFGIDIEEHETISDALVRSMNTRKFGR